MGLLETRAMRLLERGLEGTSLRHRAISSNLANINTPGYKAMRVDFFDRFQKSLDNSAGISLARTSPGHLGSEGWREVKPRVTRDNSTSMRSDGNNVDVDAEMVQLAQNQIHYQTILRQMTDRLTLLSTVINEGGR